MARHSKGSKGSTAEGQGVTHRVKGLVKAEDDDKGEAADPYDGILEIEYFPRALRWVRLGVSQPGHEIAATDIQVVSHTRDEPQTLRYSDFLMGYRLHI